MLPLGRLRGPGVKGDTLRSYDEDRTIFEVVIQQPVQSGQGCDGFPSSHAPNERRGWVFYYPLNPSLLVRVGFKGFHFFLAPMRQRTTRVAQTTRVISTASLTTSTSSPFS